MAEDPEIKHHQNEINVAESGIQKNEGEDAFEIVAPHAYFDDQKKVCVAQDF